MSLHTYVGKRVVVLTVDGRSLAGLLFSCDQTTNLVLQDTTERIIRPPDDPEPSSIVEHGLYIVRGDNVVVCGLEDEKLAKEVDWELVRGEVIGTTKHV